MCPACPMAAISPSPSGTTSSAGSSSSGRLAASLPLSDDERRAARLSRDDGDRSLREWLRRPFEELADRARDAVHGAGLAALVAAIALAGSIESVAVDHLPGAHDRLLRLLQSFIDWVRDRLARGADVDDRVYRIGQLVEIVVASIRGIVSDDVLTKGFAAIDDREFLDWLRSHGASDDALKSPVLIGGYDLAFAFRGGDPTRPSMAAGVALENAARLFFTYKGAMFWKMQAGMGDVVFAPLYQVLRRRGVEFRFFHRVTGLRLAADRRSIGAIDMARQVELVNPGVEYEPLEDVEGLPVLAGRAALGAGARCRPPSRQESRIVLGAVSGRGRSHADAGP